MSLDVEKHSFECEAHAAKHVLRSWRRSALFIFCLFVFQTLVVFVVVIFRFANTSVWTTLKSMAKLVATRTSFPWLPFLIFVFFFSSNSVLVHAGFCITVFLITGAFDAPQSFVLISLRNLWRKHEPGMAHEQLSS